MKALIKPVKAKRFAPVESKPKLKPKVGGVGVKDARRLQRLARLDDVTYDPNNEHYALEA